ncbi:Serine/threonine protein kinase PrkC, regulator of stationary phase [Acidisarcina polymorpha]|uniref:non-specific serine/threonine protein kinase n=1 Tax=Acidisarcina polymorpha TaxID=2211140 RepID=A0A2Z5FWN9_9BACT|nr:serine/threonine-protein kinase [Acidisarcina polymorpha]AXC11130.1 Serine/threonine protein kinase PrkC, regulator of stationary phase [Acidisarcina polymorpha]
MALEIGQHVGEYEILAFLGAGGMGEVYSARNVISGRVEALKILLSDLLKEADVATRFTVEIRTLATLDHPNIAQLRTAFEFQNQLVMIMEFVEGTTLERLPGPRPMLASDALNYSTQILAALAYAHSKGVTHRDVKPANIMITTHGVAKLMDFGIAKSTNDMQLTHSGSTVGSIHYMSPEQVRGGIVDSRSDIYSLGVTLYQMLTGRRPFQGDNAYTILTAQCNETPTAPTQLNPSLPPALSEAVLRAMAKEPAARFQYAEEFRQALLKVQQGAQSTVSMAIPLVPPPVAAPAPLPIATFPPAPQAVRSQRGLWLGLGAAAAIVAMVAATTLLPRFLSTHASPSPTPAVSNTPATVQTNIPSNPVASKAAPVNAGPATPVPQSRPAAGPSAIAQSHIPVRPIYHAAAQSVASGDPAVAPLPSREVNEARERLSDLQSRADAANSSIQTMRRQQQAQGYDMRGDVVAAMGRMNAHLNEANRALNTNDLQAASDDMARAEKELSTLETFLGR